MGKPASITSTPSADQGLGDLHLLGQVHAGAGRLLAVAERGVENDDASRRVLSCRSCSSLVMGRVLRNGFRIGWWKDGSRCRRGVPTLGRPGQHQPRPRGTKTPVAESIGNHHGHWKTKKRHKRLEKPTIHKKTPRLFGPWGSIVLPVREYCANLTAEGWLKPATTTAKGCAKGSRDPSPVRQPIGTN